MPENLRFHTERVLKKITKPITVAESARQARDALRQMV